VHSMEAMHGPVYPRATLLDFATERVSSVGMYLLLVPLTCGSAIFLLGGKDQHTIPGYSIMLVQTQISSSSIISTTLQTPVTDSNVTF